MDENIHNMTKNHCRGCNEDFYNGQNPHGIKECWHYREAHLVTRYKIGIWIPMDRIENFEEVIVPNCYRQVGKFAYCHGIPDHLTKVES